MASYTISFNNMEKPIIYWIRRDFRIDNNPALKFAIDTEQPIIPVFIKVGMDFKCDHRLNIICRSLALLSKLHSICG